MIPTQKKLEVKIHQIGAGLDMEDFVARTILAGEPMIVGDWLHVMRVGDSVEFPEGTRGVVVRTVSREEFRSWLARVFPNFVGCPNQTERYFEVAVD